MAQEVSAMERGLVLGTAGVSAAAFGAAWMRTLPSGSPTVIVIGAVVIAILAALYLVPTFVARRRRHHNATAILALNVLLGWTFLGWVAALVWALTRPATR